MKIIDLTKERVMLSPFTMKDGEAYMNVLPNRDFREKIDLVNVIQRFSISDLEILDLTKPKHFSVFVYRNSMNELVRLVFQTDFLKFTEYTL